MGGIMRTLEYRLSKINILWLLPVAVLAHLLAERPVSLVLIGLLGCMAISVATAYARQRAPRIGLWLYPILWLMILLTVPVAYGLALDGR
jgi:hypothetical protein